MPMCSGVREGDGVPLARAHGAARAIRRQGRRSLLVASLDNLFYFLSLNRGSRLWKRQLFRANLFAAADRDWMGPFLCRSPATVG